MRGSLAAALALACGCSAPRAQGAVDASADSAAPPDATPDAFSPATWTPAGKGLWIWYFSYTGLTADEAAQRAADDHVAYVLIKSGQDADFWSTRYTADNVAAFTSRGIHVFAWPYVTPNDVTNTIPAIAQAAAVPGTDGIVLDAEIEFEGDFPTAAKNLCQGVRAAVPGVWLGYTSFGWVGYHDTFPFSVFDQYCGDAFFPQVYWTDRGVTWQSGLSQALDMIQTAGLTAPVWPIQSNDDTPSGVSPTTADLDAFFAQAGTYASLWELPSASAPTKLAQLDELEFANAPAPHVAHAPIAPRDASLAPADMAEVLAECPSAHPDWEMAKESIENGHRVRRVSMYGKSMTTFREQSDGRWLADAAWCAGTVSRLSTSSGSSR